MPRDGGGRLIGRQVPKAGGAIIAGGDDASAIRTERDGVDVIAVRQQRRDRLTGLQVPNAGTLFVGAGDDVATIRTDVERMDEFRALDRLAHWQAGLGVPDIRLRAGNDLPGILSFGLDS